MNKTKVYIIDTCYLVELFKVPGHYSERVSAAIKDKFEHAINSRSILIVPFPCIFELANHIAHIDNGDIRLKLARKLYNTVQLCLENSSPWIIPPHTGIDNVLTETCKIFANELVHVNIGLTDTYIICEANKWKAKYSNSGYKVHIWTKDARVKANEPDTEPGPHLPN